MTCRELIQHMQELPTLPKGDYKTAIPKGHYVLLWSPMDKDCIFWPPDYLDWCNSFWDVYDITALAKEGLLPQEIIPYLVSIYRRYPDGIAINLGREIEL